MSMHNDNVDIFRRRELGEGEVREVKREVERERRKRREFREGGREKYQKGSGRIRREGREGGRTNLR